jgi:chemotaxis protein methyltransferase CheR
VDIIAEDFEVLADFIYRKAGIRFELKKMYFISKRIQRRMEELGVETPAEYIRFLRFSDRDGLEFQKLVNLLTVNETYFFRDFSQLQAFGEHCLPEVAERKAARGDMTLRIWSAGCSTGEEPYTLAIILLEMLDDSRKWDIEILASDIDQNVLARAREAHYGARSLKDVPPEYLERYFIKSGNGHHSVSPRLRKLIRFEHLNLAEKEKLRQKRGFDFIFCRNVLIYFDDVSRKQLVDSFYVSLDRGGYIFLGSSESVGRITTGFQLKRAGGYLVYYKD